MLPILSQDWSSCLYTNAATGAENIPTLGCMWIILKNVISFFLVFAGVVAVFMIIFAGVKYITAAGDKEKISSAQKTLTFAIIGLILVILALSILSFISYFTGVGLNQLTTQPIPN